jgi:hypothetical protein
VKINVLKLQFLDSDVFFSPGTQFDLEQSKRYHILKRKGTIKLRTLIFLTSRIKDPKLKYFKRPIKVTIWNKKDTINL